MTTPQNIPPLDIGQVYRRVKIQTAELRDPDSAYYLTHFQAVARLLAKEIGVERYRAWHDKHFPEDGLGFGTKPHTWKAKFTAANAALWRILDRDESHRETQIEREMRVSLDEE
ncbi:MAG TPA: hypothetical protein VI729_05235 [Anaerolineales bacterium]|nr:hypothetical protein [Anaerolineales bacterium]